MGVTESVLVSWKIYLRKEWGHIIIWLIKMKPWSANPTFQSEHDGWQKPKQLERETKAPQAHVRNCSKPEAISQSGKNERSKPEYPNSEHSEFRLPLPVPQTNNFASTQTRLSWHLFIQHLFESSSDLINAFFCTRFVLYEQFSSTSTSASGVRFGPKSRSLVAVAFRPSPGMSSPSRLYQARAVPYFHQISLQVPRSHQWSSNNQMRQGRCEGSNCFSVIGSLHQFNTSIVDLGSNCSRWW